MLIFQDWIYLKIKDGINIQMNIKKNLKESAVKNKIKLLTS